MLQKLFYEGPVATTAESYRERLDFARTMTVLCSALLVVMVALFTWSVVTVFPLGEMHGALATAILGIKVVASGVIIATGFGLVTSARDWRRLSHELAAFRGR
ncbi:MAG: hypothetical protein FWF90_13430 [Promicromonosporaceae bacterium]|nr:hypothetical protein [Promicromonosporaceae bacterium]